MTIKVGDKMPAGKLWELPVEWFAGCPTGKALLGDPEPVGGFVLLHLFRRVPHSRTCSRPAGLSGAASPATATPAGPAASRRRVRRGVGRVRGFPVAAVAA